MDAEISLQWLQFRMHSLPSRQMRVRVFYSGRRQSTP